MIGRVCIVVGLLAGGCAHAEVGPVPGTQDIFALFNHSDLVCICLVDSVDSMNAYRTDGQVPQEHAIATVRVGQMYKRDAPQRDLFQVEFDDQQLYRGENVVLFLNSTGPGVYTLADRYIGATPFKAMPTGSGGDGLEGFELQLAKIVEFPNRDDRVNALKLLEGCDNLSPEITKRIIPLTTSADPEIAFAAMAVLLKSGTATDVERVRKYVRTYSTDSAPISVVSMAYELGQVHDERAWPALCDLSRSSLLSIRIGSMQALRRIRDTQAAPCLIDRLDDSNSYVSYLGLITLAETFEKYGDYAPNMAIFDGNPKFYFNLWKAWWVENSHTYHEGSTSK